jgi:hypothetical protein
MSAVASILAAVAAAGPVPGAADIAPIVITYTAEGRLSSCDDRTPMQARGLFGWSDFEGHVEYSLEAERFR